MIVQALEALEPAELRNARYAMFGQCVVDLVGVLLVLMRYPEDVEQLSYDEVEDVKSHRYDVADVLQDVCRILGAVPSLRQMLFILEQEVCYFWVLYPVQSDPVQSNMARVLLLLVVIVVLIILVVFFIILF